MSNDSTQITLTPEQEAQIPNYIKKFNELSIDCSGTDKAAAEAAILALYKVMNEKDPDFSLTPKFVWVDGISSGAKKAAQIAKNDDNVTVDEIVSQVDNCSFGSIEAYWVAIYDFMAKECNMAQSEPVIKVIVDIVTHCGAFWTFDDVVVMVPKPSSISVENNKIHSVTGPAISWPNGDALYAANGTFTKNLMESILENKAYLAAQQGDDKGSYDTETK